MKKELWIELGYSIILAIIIMCGALLVESTNWDLVVQSWPYDLEFGLPTGWEDAVIRP